MDSDELSQNDNLYSDDDEDSEEEIDIEEDEDDDLDEAGLPKNLVEFEVEYSKDGKASHKGAGIAVMGPRTDGTQTHTFEPASPLKSIAPKTAPVIVGRSASLIVRGPYASRSNWNVSDAISPKPDFYELEQTATFVPNTKASIVASRISDCFRLLSFHCEFDDMKAKLDASTEDSAQFKVQLFAGKGDYSHGTILEMQKQRGTPRNYHEIISSVFSAAQGKQIPKIFEPNVDAINFGEFGIDVNDAEALRQSIRTIKICADMIREGNASGVVLGFERLSTLVDSTKLGSATALRNSEILLQSDRGEFIRATIASLIANTYLPKGLDDVSEYETNRLRKLAYCILSNTLTVLFDTGRLFDIVLQKWFFEDLIGFLVKDIMNADEYPHEAYMASKCLVSLVKVHKGAMDKAHDLGANVALSFAQAVGKNCHKRLSDQTTVALEIFAE